MLPDLGRMAPDRFPSRDLPRVFLGHPPAHPVAAVPLKPATRIVRMKPVLAAPIAERLARVHTEIVERTIAGPLRQLRPREPARRKLFAAVRHVFAAEDA